MNGTVTSLLAPLSSLLIRTQQRVRCDHSPFGTFTTIIRSRLAASAQVACVAVHESFQNTGQGDLLLLSILRMARLSGAESVFCLSTATMDWFTERGFMSVEVNKLPQERRELYDWERKPKVSGSIVCAEPALDDGGMGILMRRCRIIGVSHAARQSNSPAKQQCRRWNGTRRL